MPETLYAIKTIGERCKSFLIKPIFAFEMDIREGRCLEKLVIPKNTNAANALLSVLLSVQDRNMCINHFEKHLEKSRSSFFIGENISIAQNDPMWERAMMEDRRSPQIQGIIEFKPSVCADDFQRHIGKLDFIYNIARSKADAIGDYGASVCRKISKEGIPFVTFPKIACNAWASKANYLSPRIIEKTLECEENYPRHSFDLAWLIEGVEVADWNKIVDEIWQ